MKHDEISMDPAILSEIMVHRDRYFEVDETLLDHVLSAVEALGDPHRSVVEMIVWGQYSKADVARELGFSRQYVFKLWAEAKELLKEELGEMP